MGESRRSITDRVSVLAPLQQGQSAAGGPFVLRRLATPHLVRLLGDWREGSAGAVEMGSKHAAWCVGCCWALMAALFALGVMSLVWMAVVAAVIAAGKTLPWRRTVLWTTTAALLVLAVMVVAAPHAVPGLVVPGNAGSGASMGMTP